MRITKYNKNRKNKTKSNKSNKFKKNIKNRKSKKVKVKSKKIKRVKGGMPSASSFGQQFEAARSAVGSAVGSAAGSVGQQFEAARSAVGSASQKMAAAGSAAGSAARSAGQTMTAAGSAAGSAARSVASSASKTNTGKAVSELPQSVNTLVASGVNLSNMGIKSATKIVDGLTVSTDILSGVVTDTLVGTSNMTNYATSGFFGMVKTTAKSFLLANNVANSILNKALRALEERNAALASIKDKCQIPFSTGEKGGLSSRNDCLRWYYEFLKLLHKQRLPRIMDVKKRMNLKLNALLFFIKIEMEKLGCSKGGFLSDTKCIIKQKKVKDGKIVFVNQSLMIPGTATPVTKKYTELSLLKGRFPQLFKIEYGKCTSKYKQVYSQIFSWTGNDKSANDVIFGIITDYDFNYSEIMIEKTLKELCIDEIENFLKTLKDMVKKKEEEETRLYLKQIKDDEQALDLFEKNETKKKNDAQQIKEDIKPTSEEVEKQVLIEESNMKGEVPESEVSESPEIEVSESPEIEVSESPEIEVSESAGLSE